MCKNDLAFLLAHGVDVAPDTLDAELAAAVAEREARLVGPAEEELTAAEAEVLRQGGLALEPRGEPARHAVAHTVAAYAALLKTALSVAEASRRLGVDPSRIRQRLAERSLFGVRPERAWRLPSFQFSDQGAVPGLGQILPALDPELHPLEVEAFFLTPDPELADEPDGAPLSPREWLLLGRPPAAVARLAREL